MENIGIFSTPYSAVWAVIVSTDVEPIHVCELNFIQNGYTISS